MKQKPTFMNLALAAVVALVIVSVGIWAKSRSASANDAPYDPTALARASFRNVPNREAGIPPQCYTKTDGVSNPCWTCHTDGRFPNVRSDWDLQNEYAFSDEGQTNHFTNLFVDRSAHIARISDAQALEYVRGDNYAPLRAALASATAYHGYRPDLDFERGFDEGGFARDGSGWRAFRYKPFPGAFLPTNGSTDDVLIRLPKRFRERDGRPSLAVYKVNLAVLEASFATDPDIAPAAIVWPTEPLDEDEAGVDVDGDGRIGGVVTALRALPARYAGDARDVSVRRAIYPEGTEFLHSVRYIDPDAPNLIARRMKELRYSRKLEELEDGAILRRYEMESNERDEGTMPMYAGDPLGGMRNNFGWLLQGFIEDAAGRLRVQTHQEQWACMGCHTGIGVTLDQTFAFPRKVPGARGWGYQDLRGIPDVPQLRHGRPELLTYLERAGAADEFRSNDEALRRFVRDGAIVEAEVLRAAPGGDKDVTHVVAPSRERALALNKAYMALVAEQRFEEGRDAFLTPPTNVHRQIENGSTGLEENGKVYIDGQLRLDWSATGWVPPAGQPHGRDAGSAPGRGDAEAPDGDASNVAPRAPPPPAAGDASTGATSPAEPSDPGDGAPRAPNAPGANASASPLDASGCACRAPARSAPLDVRALGAALVVAIVLWRSRRRDVRM